MCDEYIAYEHIGDEDIDARFAYDAWSQASADWKRVPGARAPDSRPVVIMAQTIHLAAERCPDH